MKDMKRTVLITSLVCLVPVVAGIFLYPSMPAEMPVHWNAAGEVDRYAAKASALFLLPGLLVLLNLLMPLILKADPKHGNMSPVTVKLALWIIPALSLVIFILTAGTAAGLDLSVGRIVQSFLGVLLTAIGNFLPKTKQSYTMGIRLPWTLHSEENWTRTHRVGGFTFVLGGLAVILFTLLDLPAWTCLAAIAAMALIPAVYSYVLYRSSPDENDE